LEILALNLEIAEGQQHITVIGCYRPPSAAADALPNLMEVFNELDLSGTVFV